MGFSGTIGVAFKPWAGIFMIKSQLVLKVADRFLHIRNRAVERAVNVVLDEIVSAMARKDRVELRGFGAFSAKDKRVALVEIQELVLRSRCRKRTFLSSGRAKKWANASTQLLHRPVMAHSASPQNKKSPAVGGALWDRLIGG
jgi:hypothetical protein